MIHFHRQFDPRKIRLLIFDLDGTIIDSRMDLIQSINAMLRNFQRPELPGELIATYVGDGAPMLVRRALGDNASEQFQKQALDYFLGYYRIHKLDHTVVYEGIPQTLAALSAPCNGFQRQMAILSNKPVNPSRDITHALGLGDYFVRIYGGNSFATKKPDPEGALKLLEETGSKAEEAIIIGDSANDTLTGVNAGIWTCGVTYGFAPQTLGTPPPDVLVDTPRELGDLFA
jgi:phosphoglycolate phosphatase